ncbi:hypothetical protein [Nocardia huaxiensis]|uniref:hypothetical protein n=1 Tax=Nocardia huaxiensis TaxID=2755382 RepID=UPI001E5FD933|nr:hypothetical protein [Nocardia huaxiensis]UFS97345.1 hypothetical protein LPY97_05355 [Nocardia huaxiensis]
MPEFTPLTPDSLAAQVAERAGGHGFAVVGIDGADAADPVAFAEAVAGHIRDRGGAAEVVSVHDFIRPASLRFEYSRDDEFDYRTAWFDYAALEREVLQALRQRGEWLPTLWNERTDRSARARIRTAAPGTVLVVAGPMLLGRGLDFDLTVELRMSEAALRRKTDPADAFTLTALRTHRDNHGEQADLVVAWDHPGRPALRR